MASYHIVTELRLLVVRSIWPSIALAALSICGLHSHMLTSFVELILFVYVMLDESDDLMNVPITSTLVRLATATSVYIGFAYGANLIVNEFDLTKGLYLSTDTWTKWGLAVIVQYLNMVTILATFRLVVFGVILAFFLGNKIVAYFWPEPV